MANANPTTIAARSTKTPAPKSSDLVQAMRSAIDALDALKKAGTAWTQYRTARIAARVSMTAEPGEPPVNLLDDATDAAIAAIDAIAAMSGTRLTTDDARAMDLDSQSNGATIAGIYRSSIGGSSSKTMKSIRDYLKA
tara:strand:+ start:307 stop:720 length:414 start_codon:yes stop_codon:yes gene_type:complete